MNGKKQFTVMLVDNGYIIDCYEDSQSCSAVGDFKRHVFETTPNLLKFIDRNYGLTIGEEKVTMGLLDECDN